MPAVDSTSGAESRVVPIVTSRQRKERLAPVAGFAARPGGRTASLPPHVAGRLSPSQRPFCGYGFSASPVRRVRLDRDGSGELRRAERQPDLHGRFAYSLPRGELWDGSCVSAALFQPSFRRCQ